MPRPNLLLDSSALFPSVILASGAARALLALAEVGRITVVVSEQVVAETERAIARKVPRVLPDFRDALHASRLRIARDPSPQEVAAHRDVIHHDADVPIVVAAMKMGPDYLVTLNRRHFLDDPGVATRSGLWIGTPGHAVAWVREWLAAEQKSA
jgi:predicted nucleic acid-binding protein